MHFSDSKEILDQNISVGSGDSEESPNDFHFQKKRN